MANDIKIDDIDRCTTLWDFVRLASEALGIKLSRNAEQWCELMKRDPFTDSLPFVAAEIADLQFTPRGALAYAAAKLRETGEVGTDMACLLLTQIAEEL